MANMTAVYERATGNVTVVTGDCDAEKYLADFNDLVAGLSQNSTKYQRDGTDELLQHYIYRVAVPAVCAFGILGNVLNLVVLLQHQIRRSMDYMEKSAHMGIVALAVSDMLFCAVLFPKAFIATKGLYVQTIPFSLYYRMYSQWLINIFMLSSTWLVVVMAGARYLAICWPLHARGYINLPATLASIVLVFVCSVLFTLPEFWHMSLESSRCPINVACTCHVPGPPKAVIYTSQTLRFAYFIFKGVVGTAVPLMVLAFCNVNLIRSLRQSSKMQRKYRANAPKESSHRITLTLITMVILFFVLVCPSTILMFFKDMGLQPSRQAPHRYRVYQTVTHVFNLTQAINFSINFILYCLINVHFRKVMGYILCCMCLRRQAPNGYHAAGNQSQVTQTECLHLEETQMDTRRSPPHNKKS